MKTFSLLALAAAARLVQSHATVYAIWVNDVDQGLGNSASGYIRSPPNNSPITDVTSSSMTCNVNNVATAKTISVKGGDKITFEWHHNDRSDSDDIIASSHKGPILTYIAPTESNGSGDVWLKLAEEGYADGKWAVDNLIANKGKHSITLPDLAAGKYLLRPEIIALHEGNRQGGAQFYMECVQIEVTSSGSKTLPSGVAIPGTYTATDAGILFDIYNGFTSYPIPGPAVWDGASGTPATTSKAAASSAVATSAAAVSSQAAVSSAAQVVSSASPVSSAPASSIVKAEPTSAPISSAAAVPTTFATSVRPATSAAAVSSSAPTASSAPATGTVKKYYQCGGINYTGSTSCESGTTCKAWNPYYSQCV